MHSSSLWAYLLLLLVSLSAVLAQPVWGGYGGYPAGGWEQAPLTLPATAPWTMNRPYYEQYQAMGGIYSPQYLSYYPVTYMAAPIIPPMH